MQEAALAHRGNQNIGKSVVVIVRNSHAHAVHLDIQSGGAGDVGKGSVAIVAVQVGRGAAAPVPRPVHPVDQQNIEPAVVVIVEKSTPRPQRFGQILTAKGAVVVVKIEAGRGGDIGQLESGTSCQRAPRSARHGRAGQKNSAVHARLTRPVRIACTTSSAVL